jgi:hypothetical protein
MNKLNRPVQELGEISLRVDVRDVIHQTEGVRTSSPCKS